MNLKRLLSRTMYPRVRLNYLNLKNRGLKMNNKVTVFVLAMLALVVPAQAIDWDYVYEADAPPSAPWGLGAGAGVGGESYGTEGSTNYINLDTFNAPNTNKCYIYINNAITDISNIRVVIEARIRVYDDTTQVGGISFGDGTQRAGFNFYCDATHNLFSIAKSGGGNTYPTIPAPDPTEWHTYRIEAFGESWKLYVDDTEVWSDDLLSSSQTTYTIIGDTNATAGEADIDYDYVRIANIPAPITLLLILAGGGLMGLLRYRSDNS